MTPVPRMLALALLLAAAIPQPARAQHVDFLWQAELGLVLQDSNPELHYTDGSTSQSAVGWRTGPGIGGNVQFIGYPMRRASTFDLGLVADLSLGGNAATPFVLVHGGLDTLIAKFVRLQMLAGLARFHHPILVEDPWPDAGDEIQITGFSGKFQIGGYIPLYKKDKDQGLGLVFGPTAEIILGEGVDAVRIAASVGLTYRASPD